MRDIKSMISVMQAYADGKKIECKGIIATKWCDCIAPNWNWFECDYRIKEEPKYRPYANAEECFKDVVKHGGWVKSKDDSTTDPCYWNIAHISNDGVDFQSSFGDYSETFHELLKEDVWADDETPCGVLVEE